MKKKNNNCECNENCECGCQENQECTCNENCKCDETCQCHEEKCKCHDKKHSKKDEIKEISEKYENVIRDLSDKVLRLSAEIQNIGKRHNEEVQNMFKYEGLDFIKDILPIVDNFERAIEMDKSVNEKFLEGYKMIYSNLISILEKYEVKAIDCQDKEFDPNTMEAIMTEHVDGVEPNYVLIVLQKGYIYKDKVIRHAFVKVSE